MIESTIPTTKKEYLKDAVQHIDITKFDTRLMIESMKSMAFQARNLSRACDIFDKILEDKDCVVILCLSGSLVSAGLKKVIIEMINNNMIGAIVSTEANIIDQDIESLSFKHYIGNPFVDDSELQELLIDRIYDTFIDADELRICDDTITKLGDSLLPGNLSSRKFIVEMDKYLSNTKEVIVTIQ